MGLLGLLFKNPVVFFMLAGVLLYSIILHEMAHGWVAGLMGDSTAKDAKRLTLNPINHIDPFGALALLLVGFGWAKPVPVNPYKFKNKKQGIILVSLAGPATNFIIAAIAMMLFKKYYNTGTETILTMLLLAARINILLAAFNLIPIPPLDGSKVMMEFLPPEPKKTAQALEPYGFMILLVLIMTGLLDPLINFFQGLLISAISAVV